MKVVRALILCAAAAASRVHAGVADFLQCQLCESVKPQGAIKDCSCEFDTVDTAVNEYFIPVLKNLTSKTYFRYFRVDLDKECPFWNDMGQCANEACAVCECEDGEIPDDLVQRDKHEFDYGWVEDTIPTPQDTPTSGQYSPASTAAHANVDRESAGDNDKSALLAHLKTIKDQGKSRQDHGMEYSDLSLYDWTDREFSESSVYVNLVKNPERYTGYSGPAAQRVWRAIGQENCFGDGTTADVLSNNNDACLEKRTFYRLMSGLQGSITTQVAKEYLDVNTGIWYENVPLFVRAVGAFKERVENMYFSFLFVLRAVAKAKPLLLRYNFTSGVADDDIAVRELVNQLVGSSSLFKYALSERNTGLFDTAVKFPASEALQGFNMNSGNDESCSGAVEKCRQGFDESGLFQASVSADDYDDLHDALQGSDPSAREYIQLMLQSNRATDKIYDKASVNEKAVLFKQFRERFKNITRIMDCVSCEKCRAWGKLEMLGLGTAIKLLLMPTHILSDTMIAPHRLLSRQEIVALFNLLNQLAKSVHFASHAGEKELSYKLNEAVQMGKITSGYVILTAVIGYILIKGVIMMKRSITKKPKAM